MNVFTANKDKYIVLGRQGQNLVDQIQFPISKWIETYGTGGTFSLCHQRPNDSAAYPCTITTDDNYVYWTIGLADVAQVGYGEAQLTYKIGTGTTAKIAKSEIFQTYNLRSLDPDENPPDPWQAWVDEVEDMKDAAEAAEEKIEGMTATGSVTAGVGSPYVTITKTETTESYNLDFAFHNINGGAGGTAWGTLTGNIDDQTDLKAKLDAKVSLADTLIINCATA